MTDPTSLAASPALAASSLPTAPAGAPLHPSETRVFADMMMSGATLPHASVHVNTNAVSDAAMAHAGQLLGNGRSIEELRHGMLASMDPNDPVKTMFAMTDLSIQAQATFSKLHIATGLASAATSLFGTLLKNQQ